MFCTNCGANIPSDSRFCQECGARQVVAPGAAAKPAKNTKWVVLGFAAAFILCLIGCVLSVAIKPSINLNKYLVATFSGYDGYGQANIIIDTERFMADYGEKLVSSGGNLKNPESAVSRFLNYCTDGTADKTDHLANGDVINYIWECDDGQVFEQFGYKLKYKDVEFTVEGLETPQSFDPFEGLNVQFDGIAPNGRAEIVGTATHAAADDLWYYLDNSYELDDGMTVTMAFRCYSNDITEHLVTKYGLVPTCLEKTFAVTNLDRYATTLEEISDDSLEIMKAKAEEVFKSTLSGENEELKAFSYCGMYLVSDPEDIDSWFTNEVYLIYQVQMQNNYKNGGKSFNKLSTFYWFIRFEDLLTNDAGEVTINVDYFTKASDRINVDSGISTGWFGTKKWSYYGYDSIDTLYQTVILRNAESLTCANDVAVPGVG